MRRLLLAALLAALSSCAALYDWDHLAPAWAGSDAGVRDAAFEIPDVGGFPFAAQPPATADERAGRSVSRHRR
ncbi:MAG: hypothetical protein QM765_33335 [Myxococcales bacterium]